MRRTFGCLLGPEWVRRRPSAFRFSYLTFIATLSALFVTTSGIRITCDVEATPRANLLWLGAGALLASCIGTTGASMLSIRPLLRINSKRAHTQHLVPFFILTVANAGGMLTLDVLQILEVALVFAGLSSCLVPLESGLSAPASALPIAAAWQLFWVSGGLSALLDNAPTYAAFAALARGSSRSSLERAARRALELRISATRALSALRLRKADPEKRMGGRTDIVPRLRPETFWQRTGQRSTSVHQ